MNQLVNDERVNGQFEAVEETGSVQSRSRGFTGG
jgi:hypothetical protein